MTFGLWRSRKSQTDPSDATSVLVGKEQNRSALDDPVVIESISEEEWWWHARRAGRLCGRYKETVMNMTQKRIILQSCRIATSSIDNILYYMCKIFTEKCVRVINDFKLTISCQNVWKKDGYFSRSKDCIKISKLYRNIS